MPLREGAHRRRMARGREPGRRRSRPSTRRPVRRAAASTPCPAVTMSSGRAGPRATPRRRCAPSSRNASPSSSTTTPTRIESDRDALVAIAARETALPASPRLANVELPRTTNQLRQAAAAARDRSWCHATIDTAVNIRAEVRPLGGAVVVFGPNNFPFAFNSVAGGDFAAAIAAGNPVIAKANTSHPETSQLLAELAFDAVVAAGLPARDGAADLPHARRTSASAWCRIRSVGGHRVHRAAGARACS